MIPTINWFPPNKYNYLLQIDNRPILNFEQRKIITYLGAFFGIVYLIFLSNKEVSTGWHAYIIKMISKNAKM